MGTKLIFWGIVAALFLLALEVTTQSGPMMMRLAVIGTIGLALWSLDRAVRAETAA